MRSPCGRHEIRSHFVAEVPSDFPNKKFWKGLETGALRVLAANVSVPQRVARR